MSSFSMPVRVYLEDTDAQGVVYNASYFRFMERARTEWLRDRGVDHNELGDRHGITLVLASIEANFRSPARLGDILEVVANVVNARGARIVFEQTVCRSDASELRLLCEGTAEVACMDATSGKPRRWPEQLLRELRR